MGVTHKVPGTQPGDVRPEAVESFDLADHPVPSGREEEWRFTPLRRFARLLEGTPSTEHLALTSETLVGVVIDELASDDPVLLGLPLPVDRLSPWPTPTAPCA